MTLDTGHAGLQPLLLMLLKFGPSNGPDLWTVIIHRSEKLSPADSVLYFPSSMRNKQKT